MGLMGTWLNWWRPARVVPKPGLSGEIEDRFRELLAQEADALYEAPGWNSEPPSVNVPPSGEPWVTKTATNFVGLALSGGGIRSATFNLGLLQGLDRLGLLPSIGYLSTVSGGGYIGGFWSAWRRRTASVRPQGRPMFEDQHFPGGAIDGNDPSRVEDTPDVRHLREFSRFLSPRVGFFETEMWHAILAFVGGLIPTLTIALSVIALALLAWVGLTTYLAVDRTICGLALTTAFAAFFLNRFERDWSRTADPEAIEGGLRANFICAMSSLVLIALGFWGVDVRLDSLAAASASYESAGIRWLVDAGTWSAWRDGLFLRNQSGAGIQIYLRVFEPAIAWAAAGAALLVARLFVRSLTRPDARAIRSNAMDRVMMRLFGMAIVWTVGGLLWHIGVGVSRVGWAGAWTAAAAALSGGVFGVLRNWLTTAFKQTGHQGLLERAKPVLPMVLAYLTIGLAIVWVASVLASWPGAVVPAGFDASRLEWLLPWSLTIVVIGGALGLMLCLDPADYSLHAFYRDRISRAYLGATNPDADDRAADNRGAEFRARDDMALDELPDRPLHLICCAANDLSSDQVETLSRGSRSVTLSKHGIAMGGLWAPTPGLTLATALTASAAAFNSVMGSVSKKLGPAVTFLMTALNFRLGVWVRHPKVPDDRRELPGRSLLRELFGRTNAGLERDGQPEAPVLHLSDGAHFDNLALYELIRRHCRYIIVSDCGADAEIAFDDLGNVVRRVREDFGVEIEIDLTPLKPTPNGPATQHAVVGTIHYDRQFDKGVIVYFKPTLVGDEPPDVRQYRTRNTAFPHEGTIDQFYDEAQWESYRRLGFHSALICFRFAERLDEISADALFNGARQEWFPTPPHLRAQIADLTGRFGLIEEDLREGGHMELLAELFPEAGALSGHRPVAAPAAAKRKTPATPSSPLTDELSTATYLLKAMQTMEDVWAQCELDTQSKHPLNIGWINAFARWATAPSFRRWWPVLAPCFSPGFQRFLREQFYQSSASPLPPRGVIERVELPNAVLPPGLATDWWTTRMRTAPNAAGRVAYQYSLHFADLPDPIQVGIMIGQEAEDENGPLLRWTSEDFFVPPSLWGGRLGTGFIAALLDPMSALCERGIDTAEVHVISRYNERSASHREERISFVEFYRGARFRTVDNGTRATMPPELRALLQQSDDLDAWTSMRWWRA